MRDQRLERLAKVLVNYSTRVKKGDKVYISGSDVAIPFIVAVAREVVKAGAFVNYIVELQDISEIVYRSGNEELISVPNASFERCVKDTDVYISAWGSKSLKALSSVSPNLLQLNARANRELREIYINRSASGELRWCGTMFPTYADAQEASMSLDEYEDFVYSAGLLNHEDPIKEWERIAAEQQKLVEYLDKKSVIKVKSKDIDLTVNVKGRKWINCCGLENFPDGEIFTSPVENDINGHIRFSFPCIYRDNVVENVRLEIKDGKVVNATADKGLDFLLSTLDTDEGSRFFGEFAIGTNYGITKFTRNILFDEKIGGTMHMALGSAMPEAGGVNKSAIHWDLIADLREESQIYADDELFYENGKFIGGNI